LEFEDGSFRIGLIFFQIGFKPIIFFLFQNVLSGFFSKKSSWILKIENKVKMEMLKNHIKAVHNVVKKSSTKIKTIVPTGAESKGIGNEYSTGLLGWNFSYLWNYNPYPHFSGLKVKIESSHHDNFKLCPYPTAFFIIDTFYKNWRIYIWVPTNAIGFIYAEVIIFSWSI
jgi:hypothetical protein